MPEGLKLVVGADVSQAEKALDKFVSNTESSFTNLGNTATSELKRLDTGIKKVATDADLATGSLTELKQISKSLKGEISGLDNAMLNSRGGKALTKELSVVNTEIKALEKQANLSGQATGNALTKGFSGLRQLAFIIPGLGIAGIFNIAFEGLGKFIDGLGLLKSSFSSAAVDAELFKRASAASTDDVVRLNALVSVAKDVSLSTNQRKNAITELQRIYPNYLRNISLETINSDSARKAIDDLTQSIINKALVQEFSTRLAQELIKQSELEEDVNKRLIKQNDDIKQLIKLRNDPNTPSNALKKFTGIVEENTNKLQQSNIEFNKQGEVVRHLTDKLKALTASSLDFIRTPPVKSVKVKTERIKDLGDLLQVQTSAITLDILGIKFQKVEITDEEKLHKQLEESVKGLTPSIELEIKLKRDAADKFVADFGKFSEKINSAVTKLQIGLLEGLGEAIGTAIAGGNLKDAFSSFANILGSGLQDIGKQLVLVGGLAKLTQKALSQLFLNPALAVGVGVALIAAGAALKASLGKGIKGFAAGGLVFGPTLGLVGEGAGTNKSNPEVIAPLDKLRGMLSDIGGSRGQRFKVRGNYLLLVEGRASKSNNQLG